MSLITTGPSKIHGTGIVAAKDIPTGTVITHEDMVDAMIGFNHSCNPNLGCVLFTDEKKPYRIVLRSIKAGEELVCDYGVHNAKPTTCLCPVCLP
jgi:SET domain